MITRLLAASGNRHKIGEILSILGPAGVELLDPATIGGIPPVVEDGDTFAANAIKKATAVARATGWTVLADDSGLEVIALGGAPGVHSARYSGPGATDATNLAKLLGVLQDVTDRRARFVCVIAVATPTGWVETAQGSVTGNLLTAPRGMNGFGYDPLFVPTGYALTFAELPAETKNRISHRAEALRTVVTSGLLTRIPHAPQVQQHHAPHPGQQHH